MRRRIENRSNANGFFLTPTKAADCLANAVCETGDLRLGTVLFRFPRSSLANSLKDGTAVSCARSLGRGARRCVGRGASGPIQGVGNRLTNLGWGGNPGFPLGHIHNALRRLLCLGLD